MGAGEVFSSLIPSYIVLRAFYGGNNKNNKKEVVAEDTEYGFLLEKRP
jgi:hypothetical protein